MIFICEKSPHFFSFYISVNAIKQIYGAEGSRGNQKDASFLAAGAMAQLANLAPASTGIPYECCLVS